MEHLGIQNGKDTAPVPCGVLNGAGERGDTVTAKGEVLSQGPEQGAVRSQRRERPVCLAWVDWAGSMGEAAPQGGLARQKKRMEDTSQEGHSKERKGPGERCDCKKDQGETGRSSGCSL